MITYNIKAQFPTMREAVEYAKIDMSYNPSDMMNKVNQMDRQTVSGKTVAAYVCQEKNSYYDENIIFYLYECDITLLNEYSKSCSMISSSPFHPVKIDGRTIQINDEDCYPKTKEVRKLISESKWIVTSF
jgi:hypothetical protein